ncbi:hypothetical protein FE257_001099 [Aspergillus nanangensis]|uniref:Uncharacterized protein n=1 Tax=Aspergillus nanangensis TaxID=2582783 RepID=A0AAD4CVX4_ASPNN|nr:hypothetical protein FE257_001099 [Aspergillus nanangensis]
MGHHCTICRRTITTNCMRRGHLTECPQCLQVWVPLREKECPYCLNAREKAEQRLQKGDQKADQKGDQKKKQLSCK